MPISPAAAPGKLRESRILAYYGHVLFGYGVIWGNMGILHRQLSQRKARSTDARNMGIFLPKNMGGNMGISDPVGGRTRSADSKKIWAYS